MMLLPALGRLVFQAPGCPPVEALFIALNCNIISSTFLAFVWEHVWV